MRRNVPNSDAGPGQDSFLDIVANLVGILIILVMVVGVNAKDALRETAPGDEQLAASKQAAAQARNAATTAAAVEADVFEIDAKVKQQEFDVAYRRAERERVQLLVAATKEQLDEKRNQLGEAQRDQFDVRREISNAESVLQEIRNQIGSLKSTAAPVAVIEHLPTPMAKTVFGQELHVRLQQGRVVPIPWDALVEELKATVPQRLHRLQGREEMTETLGPVGGFFMKYTLARRRHAVSTRIGIAVQQGVELDHFVLLPVAENLGEPLGDALREGSEFWQAVGQHRPETTTITVWTYPDSFNDFRRLKQVLYPRGYLVASRPLPEGFPIGGSPRGLRSAAQ